VFVRFFGLVIALAQHAFRKNKGTDTALSEAVDKIEARMLRKEYTLGVFLDIAGAFNNLSFESAIRSMRDRKFPPKIVDWYKISYTTKSPHMN
jgi:hypothetical protein